jgi:hypothetical protein
MTRNFRQSNTHHTINTTSPDDTIEPFLVRKLDQSEDQMVDINDTKKMQQQKWILAFPILLLWGINEAFQKL